MNTAGDKRKPRWRRIVAWSLAALVVLLAGVTTWLFTANLGVFKPQIERFVTRLLEREFSIDGQLSIELGENTVVIAEGLRLANADWADEEAFAEVARIEAHVDLWSLFDRPVVIRKLDLDHGKAHLQRSVSSGHNWPRPARRAEAEPSGSDAPREALLSVEEASIDDVLLTYVWPARPDGLTAELHELRQKHGDDDYLDLELEATVDGHALKINGNAGTWTSLITGQSFEYMFDAVGDDAELRASGSLESIARLDGIVFDVSTSGPDFGRIMAMFGSERFAGEPFSAQIEARSEVQGLTIHQAEANIGDTRFSASGVMPKFPSVDDAHLEARVSGPDVALVRELVGAGPGATGPFDITAVIEGLDDGTERINAELTTDFFVGKGTGVFDVLHGLEGGRARIEAEVESMRRLLEIWSVEGLPDLPASVVGGLEYAGDRINFFEAVNVETEVATFEIGGGLSLTTGALGSEFEIAVSGESLPTLLEALELDVAAPDLTYEVSGGLLIESGAYGFRAVSGRLGRTRFALDGGLTTRADLAGSAMTYSASGPALEELLTEASDLRPRPGEFSITGRASVGDDLSPYSEFVLVRPAGRLEVKFERLGGAGELRYDVNAQVTDVRTLTSHIGSLVLNPLSLQVVAIGGFRDSRWQFDNLDVALGAATLKAQGVLDLAPADAKSEFRVDLDVPTLQSLGIYRGHRLRDGPLRLAATIIGQNGEIRADDIEAAVSGSPVFGSLSYLSGEVPEFVADFRAETLVLAPLLQPLDSEEPGQPAEEPAEESDGLIIPDTPISTEWLKEFKASVRLDIEEFVYDERRVRGFDLDVELHDGVLEMNRLDIEGLLGWLRASGKLDASLDLPEAQFELVARGFRYGWRDVPLEQALVIHADIAVSSSGRNVRELAGNSNGAVYLDTRGGRVQDSRFLAAYFGNLLGQIISLVRPAAAEQQEVLLECAILALSINDGQVQTTPTVYIGMPRMLVAVNGTADLKTEELDFGIRSTPNSRMSLSAGEIFNPFIKISGTFANAGVGVDEQGVLLTGGAAVATGGLSILAKAAWDRVARSSDPCGDTTTAANEALAELLPSLGEYPKAAAEEESGD